MNESLYICVEKKSLYLYSNNKGFKGVLFPYFVFCMFA